ncbi:MAG TPA: S-methyl-5-thioribose-1-phosphate isomerase, partial [Phycisphaerae bacterium]
MPKTTRTGSRPLTLRWIGTVEGSLEILDQRKLPGEVIFLKLQTVEDVWEAIKTLAVRGAPAIGVAAAFGMVLAARTIPASSQAAVLIEVMKHHGEYLKSSRPTAVNLEWAVDHMIRIAITERSIGVRQLQRRLLHEAKGILEEDRRMCQAIGKNGVRFMPRGKDAGVLTHCNAGALATADQGTALSIIYEAQKLGMKFHVYADETRPLLQGARLTAWELQASGVDVTLICDNMAGLVMKQGKVQAVIVGADRIARNGDTANKIGTYSVALLARAHDIPFYVAAPSNSFDLSLASGEEIPIEERAGDEITEGFGKRTAPVGVKTYNPAFDVTPGYLIAAIVTERGVVKPVNEKNVIKVVDGR